MKFSSILASALFFLTSCKSEKSEPASTQNHTLRGQVFVIQKNKINVKLGGVDVYFIPMTEFRKRCTWIDSQRSRSIEVVNYKQRLTQIDDWLIDIGVARSAQQLRTFLSTASQIQSKAHNCYEKNPEIVEFRRIENLRKSNSDLFESSEISNNETCQWIATCLFFDWKDRNAGRATKTDADGNFTMTVTKSAPGVIMMNSSRQLGGGMFENYYWLKEVTGDELDPLIFSSADTISGGFLMETVRQASQPRRTSQKIIQDELGLVDLDWATEANTIFARVAEDDAQIKVLENKISAFERTISDIRYTTEP